MDGALSGDSARFTCAPAPHLPSTKRPEMRPRIGPGFAKDLLRVGQDFAQDWLRICPGFEKDCLGSDKAFATDLLRIPQGLAKVGLRICQGFAKDADRMRQSNC